MANSQAATHERDLDEASPCQSNLTYVSRLVRFDFVV